MPTENEMSVAPTTTDDSADPEYRIAYDVDRRKVGCVLIQAVLGTVPSKLFHDYFGNGEAWIVDASGCQVFRIRRSQLPLLAARTDFTR